MKFIKRNWCAINNRLADSPDYFKKSPSNILQSRAIIGLLKEHATGTLLDIGAGRSIYKKYIPEGVKYHAMDYEETESTYAKQNDLDIIGDVQKMEMADNTYETILCTEVLEHVPHPHDATKEMVRVLKPGGVAIITVPFLGYYHDEPYDFFRYTKHGLRVLFEDAGAEVIEQRGLGGLFSFLGYIRSTIVLSLFFRVPVVWWLLFRLNYLCSLIDISLDTFTKTSSIMPLTNVIVVRKPKKK